MNIHSYDVFPQFLVYDEEKDKMEPMTEENSSVQSWQETGFFGALLRFFRSIIQMFAKLLGIEGIM